MGVTTLSFGSVAGVCSFRISCVMERGSAMKISPQNLLARGAEFFDGCLHLCLHLCRDGGMASLLDVRRYAG